MTDADKSRSRSLPLPDLFTAAQWQRLAEHVGLPPRQRQIARLICRGASTDDIALRIGVTERTVRMHKEALFKHLNIHDRIGVPIRLVLAHRELATRHDA